MLSSNTAGIRVPFFMAMSIPSARVSATAAMAYTSFSYVLNLDFDCDNFIYEDPKWVDAGISVHDVQGR